MKGIIFNLLEDVVTTAHGAETWQALLDGAGLEGAYTSLGSYPDAELLRLVAAAAARLGTSPDEVVRWFGTEATPLLAQRFPDFFAPHTDTLSFLATLNDIIHLEVRKLYPDADVPHFDIDRASPSQLTLAYRSPRRLCALAEGFILGSARHYTQRVRIDRPRCLKRGDDHCLIVCELDERRQPE